MSSRWLVVEKTWVTADTEEEAINAAVNCRKGYDQEIEEQSATAIEDLLPEGCCSICGAPLQCSCASTVIY